jgi:hypothetical protein
MRKWLGCLCLLAACSGGGGSNPPDDGPYGGEYPWGSQNQNGEQAQVKASIRAVGNGGTTTVSVALWKANAFQQRTELARNDRLSARIGDELAELELANEVFSGAPIYVATFAGDAPGTQVEVTLDSEQWGDARAELTLPDRVRMTSPSGDTAPDLEEPVQVTWDDSTPSDMIGANYERSCGSSRTTGWNAASQDEGFTEIKLKPQEGPCTLLIGVERQKYGTMEGSWGGSAVGAQADDEEWLLP